MVIKEFVFNDFQENTYLVYDDSKQCLIVDPGCYYEDEKMQIKNVLKEHDLNPVLIVNTHCHFDHILGNKYIKDTYNIPLYAHQSEQALIDHAPEMGQIFGIQFNSHVNIDTFISDGDIIKFGKSSLEVIYIPGHSIGSIGLYTPQDNWVIVGDVLFQGSIGRTDLPGGDYNTLINSIHEKLLILPENTVVYPGHGPSTTIKEEKTSNPFLKN